EASERLLLELARACGAEAEAPADLAERLRRLAAGAEAQVDDRPLLVGERVDRLLHGLVAQRVGDLLLRAGLLGGDQRAEGGLAVVADRQIERRRLAVGLRRLEHQLELEPGLLGELLVGRVAAQLRRQLAPRARDLAGALSDVDRQADRAAAVLE